MRRFFLDFVRTAVLFVACVSHVRSAYVASITDYGAIAGVESVTAAWQNAAAFNAAFEAVGNGTSPNDQNVVIVPDDGIFYFLPPTTISNAQHVKLVVNGTIQVLRYALSQPVWPIESPGHYQDLLSFVDCEGLEISGPGLIDGDGFDWWWARVFNEIADTPGTLVHTQSCTDVLVHDLHVRNGMRFHFYFAASDGLEVHNVNIFVDVDRQVDLNRLWRLHNPELGYGDEYIDRVERRDRNDQMTEYTTIHQAECDLCLLLSAEIEELLRQDAQNATVVIEALLDTLCVQFTGFFSKVCYDVVQAFVPVFIDDVRGYNNNTMVCTSAHGVCGPYQGEANVPMYPLNTDGIDPSGRNIHIHDVNITNYDDAVAVKPSTVDSAVGCTRNVLIENAVVTWGVGMSIGSVPPSTSVNCVEDVLVRNVTFDHPTKALYVKTNGGHTGTGRIRNVTYEDISITEAIWYPIYVGPQQQKEPNSGGDGWWPDPQPRINVTEIHFVNVHARDTIWPQAGVVRCNATNPCQDITFDNVTVTGVLADRVGYVCENAFGSVSSGTYPTPACLVATTAET